MAKKKKNKKPVVDAKPVAGEGKPVAGADVGFYKCLGCGALTTFKLSEESETQARCPSCGGRPSTRGARIWTAKTQIQ